MSVHHHSMARTAAETMLHNWKHDVSGWDSGLISHNVFLAKSLSAFPSPDGSFHDPDNRFYVAMEFKPPRETKRGILTGLGQCLAYLNAYSMAYFVCPEHVEGFKVDTFMKKIFDKNSLSEKLPVGLISYKNSDPSKLEILSEITAKAGIEQTSAPRDTRYWAKYLDTCPHLIWTLLNIAFNLQSKGDRRKKIYRKFFDKFYFPKKHWSQLQIFDSPIIYWDGSPMHPFSTTIRNLNRDINRGNLTRGEALQEMRRKIDHNFVGDNLYNSYRKNYFPFLDHLGLWDDQGFLTPLGYDLHKTGKLHGSTSKAFKDHLARIILVKGRHLDLILDIEKYTRNKPLETSLEARSFVYDKFEEKGLVKQNPNRSASGDRKNFSNEMQLWVHLGVLRKTGNSYFQPRKGFDFDWKEITRIVTAGGFTEI